MLAERLEAKTGYSQYLVKNLSPSLFPFLLLVLSFLPGLTGFDVAESRVGGSDGLKTLPLFNTHFCTLCFQFRSVSQENRLGKVVDKNTELNVKNCDLKKQVQVCRTSRGQIEGHR